jgi:imidazolonepropionase-like amidohydrolase
LGKQEGRIRILCGKLYTGTEPVLRENKEIWISGGRIEAVRDREDRVEGAGARAATKNAETTDLPYSHAVDDSTSENVETIDLSHLTVTPGMIDAHTHPSFVDPRDLYDDAVKNSDGWRALSALRTATRSLEGGFTTIRAIGWFQEDSILDVRRFIAAGHLPGARVVAAAHALGTTGSHGDFSQPFRDQPRVMDFLARENPGTGDGPDFFVRAVRREAKLGADFIKIMATGGFASPNDGPEDIQLNDEEFAAIFSTAKAVGIPVTAHAYTSELIEKLVDLGISGIEHGSLMDEHTARKIEAAGVYVVPTFNVYDTIIHGGEAALAGRAPAFRAKLIRYRERLAEGRKVILNSRIKLGYGTDMVVVHHNYENGWEYSSWLKNGIDPFRALEAATKTNAEILGIADRTGTIEPGKHADIAGWGRDLTTDPDALRDCAFVMKEGVAYPAKSHIGITD